MIVADELSPLDERRRRHRRRPRSNRTWRNLRNGWRRTRIRSVIVTVVLAVVVVLGGYKATMAVLDHEVNVDEFRTNAK